MPLSRVMKFDGLEYTNEEFGTHEWNQSHTYSYCIFFRQDNKHNRTIQSKVVIYFASIHI